MISRILLVNNGRESPLTVQEWLAMPLPKRVGHLSDGTVQFYSGSQRLSAREALAELKKLT